MSDGNSNNSNPPTESEGDSQSAASSDPGLDLSVERYFSQAEHERRANLFLQDDAALSVARNLAISRPLVKGLVDQQHVADIQNLSVSIVSLLY